jgi:MinD-like ATPase involved in chromosome partitioning or flagellar assembly
MSETATRDVTAFVGATGGAGTTRTVVEVAAALAADGREVTVIDAAFATQGLASYVSGRIEPDLTALLTDAADAPISRGSYALDLREAVPGRISICPANAPFERLARAKTPEAAQRLESRIETAAAQSDTVLVDVPPIAANQAVAAVNGADRHAVVTPASERGRDAVGRCHDRLADLGVEASLVVSTRGELETADVAIPETDAGDERDAPACLCEGGEFAAAIERVAAAVTGREITAEVDSDRGLLGAVGEYVGR